MDTYFFPSAFIDIEFLYLRSSNNSVLHVFSPRCLPILLACYGCVEPSSTNPNLFPLLLFLEQKYFAWCFAEAESVGKRSGR